MSVIGMGLNIRRLIAQCLVLASLLQLAVPAYGQASLYRYRNAEGVLVMDFSIPPEFVAKGYEVVTPTGLVLQEVEPLTGSAEEIAEAIRRKENQQKEDDHILRSYSSLEDIERARDRKLVLVEREISILESNLEDFDRRRVELRERAAGYQASGQEAPASIARVPGELDLHEVNTRKLLAERRLELNSISRRYDRYGERLVILRPSTARDEAISSETESPQ